MNTWQNKIMTTDDLCLSNLKYFKYWDKVKEKYGELKLVAFTIANYRQKEKLDDSKQFKDWFDKYKDWVEIAIHGYDHSYPPEAERDDFEDCVSKALEILKSFLPKEYGYRSPGFKFTVRLEPVLKKLGFGYVAYDDMIKYFDGRKLIPYNTHCCNKYENPITKIWDKL